MTLGYNGWRCPSSRVLPPARPASCISATPIRRASRGRGRGKRMAQFLLRIEDIDIRRSRREFETAIREDLHWLGLDWDGEVRRQSEHFADYGRALDVLDARGLIYPCFCTRADIARPATRTRRTPRSRGRTDLCIPAPAATCRARSGASGSRRGRSIACASMQRRRQARRGHILRRRDARAGSRASHCCSATSCWRARTRRPAITSRSRSTITCRA